MSGNGQPSSPARPPDPVTGRCLPAGLAERALTTKKGPCRHRQRAHLSLVENTVLTVCRRLRHHCPNLDAFALASALHLTQQSDCPAVHSPIQMRSEH